MEKASNLLSIRVDELPLLYSVIHGLGISAAINSKKKVHGNWVGLSLGGVWLPFNVKSSDYFIEI